MAPSADGGGYWLLEADGPVAPFGDALTAAPGGGLAGHCVGQERHDLPCPYGDGKGYVMVDSAGQAFSFGDAPYLGDEAANEPGYSGRVVGIAATPG